MTTPLSEYRPFRFDRLPAPVTITEAGGEVLVLSLVATLPAGDYLLSVSLVSQFTSANDQLTWRVGGSFPTPSFLKEAKDADEVQPFAYIFPQPWAGGEMTLEILASIDGSGNADVDILAANITTERKGE